MTVVADVIIKGYNYLCGDHFLSYKSMMYVRLCRNHCADRKSIA